MLSADGKLRVVYTEAAARQAADGVFLDLAKRHGFSALIVVTAESDSPSRLVNCVGFAPEPLSGAESQLLSQLVKDCTAHYANAHVHSLKDDVLGALARFSRNVKIGRRVVFVPLLVGQDAYALFAFPCDGQNPVLDEHLLDDIQAATLLTACTIDAGRLTTVELFVKEVGHDIASAVQASVSKLRNISKGLYRNESVKQKAKEAEEEILGAYRVAEGLGVVVDPEYNIGNGTEFDLRTITRRAVERHEAEANERHISLRTRWCAGDVTVWGDATGIESAIGQYILNAIKYANGGSFITIEVFCDDKAVGVRVTDKGVPLNGDEILQIWDFGFRGRDALERHVNGSGIGLFSVRKIINAHGGTVKATSDKANPRLVTFEFVLPRRDILAKAKLL